MNEATIDTARPLSLELLLPIAETPAATVTTHAALRARMFTAGRRAISRRRAGRTPADRRRPRGEPTQ